MLFNLNSGRFKKSGTDLFTLVIKIVMDPETAGNITYILSFNFVA